MYFCRLPLSSTGPISSTLWHNFNNRWPIYMCVCVKTNIFEVKLSMQWRLVSVIDLGTLIKCVIFSLLTKLISFSLTSISPILTSNKYSLHYIDHCCHDTFWNHMTIMWLESRVQEMEHSCSNGIKAVSSLPNIEKVTIVTRRNLKTECVCERETLTQSDIYIYTSMSVQHFQ